MHSMMSLLRTHLKLSAPLGPLCVHMACGNQVKLVRNFLFKLIDSELPPAIDQVSVQFIQIGIHWTAHSNPSGSPSYFY